MKRPTLSSRQPAWLASICALAIATLAPGATYAANITIQADQPGVKVSPTLYGIFFEEINCAGDGGLYAELIRNRSFEDGDQPDHWKLETQGGAQAELAIDRVAPQSAFNQQALKVSIKSAAGGGVAVVNSGYWGIALKSREPYRFSLRAKAGDGFAGPLVVSLENAAGTVYASKRVAKLGAGWQTYEFNLTPTASDPQSRLVIRASQPGTVWLDMVSLFPKRTFHGRNNGLRTDLAQKLQELQPAFVRFPGGCWVEGDRMKDAYRWKQTIGPLAERRTQYNIWQYRSTHGLGYHEYLQLCEDLGSEPLFVINCGMSHKEVVPMAELGEYVQDALDAIEYANGPATSTWGAKRAQNGHAKPFHLRYMEIGNENGGSAYHERYGRFYDAIKAQYPDMNLVANVWGGSPTNRPAEIVDEHYYSSPQFFISQANKYDTYDRKGPKVYVGEYAVTERCGQGNLMGALGEAAFMTGMERNSDVVVMASYAPLFANVNYKKWNPDLIDFDGAGAYGIPSFYVQKLFAQNRGDRVLPATVEADEVEAKSTQPKGAVGLATWDTQAEFKDIKVVHDGKTLFADDFSSGAKNWKIRSGNWRVEDGAFRQTGEGSDLRATAGDESWTDYTYTLKARKLSGAEGFLVLFHTVGDDKWMWWNVGGWSNTRHAIERGEEGGKFTVGDSVSGAIETGKWYDLKVETAGERVRCYLDGKLIHDCTSSGQRFKPLHAVAGTANDAREIILKVVNVGDAPQETAINIQGVKGLGRTASASWITGQPADENSLTSPEKIATLKASIPVAGPQFKYTFPAYSVSVIRLRTK